jgi:hypothetical protein
MSRGKCHCERREAIQTAAAHRLGRHIGTPGVAARARRLRQRLAMFLGAVEPAKIGAFARSRAGDEEPHVALLRGRAAADEGEKGGGGGRGESGAMRIVSPIYVGSGKDVPAPAIFRGCSHGASQSRVVIPAQPGNQTIARLPVDSRSRFARPE